MTHIQITKGLDIPIGGRPEGNLQELKSPSEGQSLKSPKKISLNLDPFEEMRFSLLAKVGDRVKRGDPLVEDKQCEGRVFASPAGGTVSEIRRGLKRRLLDVVIDVDEKEEVKTFNPIDPAKATCQELLTRLLEGGIFAHIRSRPFNRLADPKAKPRTIFVKAVETAPFTPPAELQIQGRENDFATGLKCLAKLTDGKVHLVYKKDCTFKAFTEAKEVEKHTVSGPHPAANVSLHIEKIDPIRSAEDVVWTLSAWDVAAIGHLLNSGHYLVEKVISIAGPGLLAGASGYFKIRSGYPISSLIASRLPTGSGTRLISGDPLMGKKVEATDFLKFYDTVFAAIPEPSQRELLHFFRLGGDKFSISKAYLSGHEKPGRIFPFTTSKHGESRPFIDATLYDKVMPLDVSTMPLVKAVMAEDYDLAEELGLLDVAPEDFALTTFVCPSKVEMTEIIKQGLYAHSKEVAG